MRNSLRFCVCVAVGVRLASAEAYELSTHAFITDAAYEQSQLGSNSALASRLGLVDAPGVVGPKYFDMGSQVVRTRESNKYELKWMPPGTVPFGRDRRIRGWLMRGAIREDDGEGLAAFWAGEPWLLDKDPDGNLNRFCNHFYDPIKKRGLVPDVTDDETGVICGPSNRRKSVDWATGAIDPFAQFSSPVLGYRNHFTIYSAREAMWRALTLRQKDGAPVAYAGSGESARRSYWATAFRALGSIGHLVQDAAQPQHTRNEPHPPGEPARYEKYTEERLRGAKVYSHKEAGGTPVQITRPQLILDADQYPTPVFSSYGKYWSDTSSGRGMADYSNRGFLTPGRWFNDSSNDYALPSSNAATYATETGTPSNDVCAAIVQAKIRYLISDVVDTFSGPPQSIRMATVSNSQSTFGLNDCAMDDRAALLLPRAVAYTAGIIDHFFRCKLTIGLPPDGVYSIVDHSIQKTAGVHGFKKLTVNVKNDTADLGSQPQSMSGIMVAVVKFHRNTCYAENLSGEWGWLRSNGMGADVFKATSKGGCRSDDEEIVVSDIVPIVLLNPGSEKTIAFNFVNVVPIEATDVYLQVVFRGGLGDEDDAVVVETKDIGEPAFTTYQNSTDYVVCHNENKVLRAAPGSIPQYVIDEYPIITLEKFAVRYGANTLVRVTPLEPNPGDLAPGQLIRFATLGNLDSNWWHSGEIDGEPFTVAHGVPINERTRANQIYHSYDEATRRSSFDQRGKDVFRTPFGYAPFGRTYYVGNSDCVGPYPADLGNPPMLRGVAIEYQPIAP